MRHARIIALAAVALLAVPGAADARKPAPHLSWVRCFGKSCTDKRVVAPGGYVKVGGRRLRPGLRVVFRANTKSRTRTVKAQAIGSKRLLARVPLNARSGWIFARAKHGVRTNGVGPIKVRAKRKRAAAPPVPAGGPPSGTAFDGDAMWIWELPKAEGGDPAAIARRAQLHGVETVFVKSGDGVRYWTQFNPGLVQALHDAGLRVCAWQYVYGSDPTGEAAVSTRAVQEGADCFVIDAEKEYEKRYAQAQAYIRTLRQAVGPAYPIGMSSFPYVDYHPAFPYSEFFAPGGAQFNAPQIYWKTIGDTVDTAVDHTYRYNRPYSAAIVPVGQSYNSPPASDLRRFRQLAAVEGSAGLSWWEWAHTDDPGWDAVGAELDPFTGTPPATDLATLASGAKGDLVVWAQEHLQSAGAIIAADGDFGPSTQAAVTAFQAEKGLPQTAQVDTPTWQALLPYSPQPRTYAKTGVQAKRAAGANAGPPASASLPAKRYEIPDK